MKLTNKTNPELLAMCAAIEADPLNHMPPGGLWLYTPKARKKLDEIRREITNNMIEAKKAAGTYVEPAGYSGRQTNRR